MAHKNLRHYISKKWYTWLNIQTIKGLLIKDNLDYSLSSSCSQICDNPSSQHTSKTANFKIKEFKPKMTWWTILINTSHEPAVVWRLTSYNDLKKFFKKEYQFFNPLKVQKCKNLTSLLWLHYLICTKKKYAINANFK